MKRNLCLLTVAALGVVLLTGCKKEESANSATTTTTEPGVTGVPSSTPTAVVDTSEAERQFATAEPTVKSSFESAATAVRAGNYSEALAKLQQLASNAKLTEQQKQAIKDLLAQVQAKGSSLLKDTAAGATNAVNRVGDAANKAASDLKNSLGK